MRVALLDFDGTLLDSFGDIISAANYMLRKLDRPTLPIAQVRSYIGDGLRPLLTKCLSVAGESDDAVFARAEAIFRARYAAHCLDTSRLYDGAREFLDSLTNVKLALVSNKHEDACLDICRSLGVNEYFEVIVGGDTFTERKPHPEPLLRVLDRLGVTTADAVMVGDGVQDIRAGVNAQVWTIGVTWGINDRPTLERAGADVIVDSFDSLTSTLAAAAPRPAQE